MHCLWKLSAILGVAASTIGTGVAADEPTGIRVGAFLFQPSLAASARYDTNVFLSDGNEEGSLQSVAAPRVELRSDWNRHALVLTAGAQAGLFTHDSADNFLDYDVGIAGELDITRNFRVNGSLTAEHMHEQRGSVDTPASLAGPVSLDSITAQVEANLRTNLLRFTPFGRWQSINFDDVGNLAGGTANQDDRDRVEIEGGMEIGLRIRRGYEAFLRGSLVSIDYRAGLDDQGLDRDSEGWRVLAGVKLKLARLVEGSAAIGVVNRDFADATLGSTQSVSAALGLEWRPTRRLSVVANARRDIDETTVDVASSALSTELGLGLRYELLRPLILTGQLAYTHTEFDGTARADDLFEIGLGAEWEVRRGLRLIPAYAFAMRQSSEQGADYQAHALTLTGAYDF